MLSSSILLGFSSTPACWNVGCLEQPPFLRGHIFPFYRPEKSHTVVDGRRGPKAINRKKEFIGRSRALSSLIHAGHRPNRVRSLSSSCFSQVLRFHDDSRFIFSHHQKKRQKLILYKVLPPQPFLLTFSPFDQHHQHTLSGILCTSSSSSFPSLAFVVVNRMKKLNETHRQDGFVKLTNCFTRCLPSQTTKQKPSKLELLLLSFALLRCCCEKRSFSRNSTLGSRGAAGSCEGEDAPLHCYSVMYTMMEVEVESKTTTLCRRFFCSCDAMRCDCLRQDCCCNCK